MTELPGLESTIPEGRRKGPGAFLTAALATLVIIGVGGYLALRAFTSTSQAIAAAMPPDTGVYLSVDLLQLFGEERTGDLFRTVRRVLADLGRDTAEPDEIVAALDEELQTVTGFDFSNDIRPWLGRTAGLGLIGDVARLEDSPQGVVVLEVRDVAAADTFLDELARALPQRTGEAVSTTSYKDVRLLITNLEDEAVAIGRSGRTFLIGTRRGVEKSIDAQAGTSLLDVPAFTETTGLLPGDRAVTAWVSGDLFQDLAGRFGGVPVAPPPEGADSLLGGALGITVTDHGVAVDIAASFSGLPDGYAELFAGRGSVPELLPDDTYAFVEYPNPAGVWRLMASQDEAATLREELDAVATEWGFHPVDDLVVYLDGPFGVALVRSEQGMLAEESGFDVGLLVVAGTSAPDRVTASLDALTGLLVEEGLPVVPDQGLFSVTDAGREVFAYGVRDGLLLAGSNTPILQQVGPAGARLDSSAGFSRAVRALPASDQRVILYADVNRLSTVFGAREDVSAALEPIDSIVASTQIEARTVRATVLVVID